jgi:hypothetical protein
VFCCIGLSVPFQFAEKAPSHFAVIVGSAFAFLFGNEKAPSHFAIITGSAFGSFSATKKHQVISLL